MLLALEVNELGFLFGTVPGPRAFHWACLFLGLGEWAFSPIFKPYQKRKHRKIAEDDDIIENL